MARRTRPPSNGAFAGRVASATHWSLLTAAVLIVGGAWLLVLLPPESWGTSQTTTVRLESDERPDWRSRRGIYLTSALAAHPERLTSLVESALAHGLNTVVIDVKDRHGTVAYDTQVPLSRVIGAHRERFDASSLVRRLKKRGLYLVARQVVFYDPALATHLASASNPWVDPADPRAVSYNLSIAREVADAGFDEIQFDYLRYPDGATFDAVYAARYRAVTRFLEQAHDALGEDIHISVDVFGRTLRDWNRKRVDPIGQSLESLMPYADVLSPMVYPSHYESARYWNDPYGTVKQDLDSGLRRNLRLRPFLQAFEQRLPDEMSLASYIRAQVQAVRDLGVDGHLFWNPRGEYGPLWQALARTREP